MDERTTRHLQQFYDRQYELWQQRGLGRFLAQAFAGFQLGAYRAARILIPKSLLHRDG